MYGEAVKLWRRLVPDVHQRRFMAHNRAQWKKREHSGREVLFNNDSVPLNYIRFSYVTNALADLHGARVKAFVDVDAVVMPVERRLLRSFGVAGIVNVHVTSQIAALSDQLFHDVRRRLTTKQDLWDLVIRDVWIGVDIYDTYLRQERKATVDLSDARLDRYIRGGIARVLFWQDYFATHDVAAVVVSHDAYLPAMSVRKVANQVGVTVYSPDPLVPTVRTGEFAAAASWPRYRQLFAQLPVTEQMQGTAAAHKQLERRFAGETNINMPNIETSAWHGQRQARVITASPRPKVLVCTHEFADAPNVFGGMIFVDFWEWLEYLGKFSERSHYDWYIKMHPDFWPVSEMAVADFIRRYPRFRLVPARVSHHQLIDEGVTCALTCYGSIGHEYPARGVLVIHAGYNRHVAYEFSFHARSIPEYEQLLLAIPELHVKNPADIAEFYYMNHYEELVELSPVPWWREWVARLSDREKVSSAVYSNFVAAVTPPAHAQLIDYWRRVLPMRLDHPAEITLAS